MKQFIARCFALPVVDDVEDEDGYTVGRLYIFNLTNDLPWSDSTCSTVCDDGTKHCMDDAYFNEYFTRVFSDKDGYYVER
jgi:hypothetical protein